MELALNKRLPQCWQYNLTMTLLKAICLIVFCIESTFAQYGCETDNGVLSVSGGKFDRYKKRDNKSRCEGYIIDTKSTNLKKNDRLIYVRSLLHADVVFLTKEQKKDQQRSGNDVESFRLHIEPYFDSDDSIIKEIIKDKDIDILAEEINLGYRLDAQLKADDIMQWSREVIDERSVGPNEIWVKGEVKSESPDPILIPVMFYENLRPEPTHLTATLELLAENFPSKFDITLKCDGGETLQTWKKEDLEHNIKKKYPVIFELQLNATDCAIQNLNIQHDDTSEDFWILRKTNDFEK